MITYTIIDVFNLYHKMCYLSNLKLVTWLGGQDAFDESCAGDGGLRMHLPPSHLLLWASQENTL